MENNQETNTTVELNPKNFFFCKITPKMETKIFCYLQHLLSFLFFKFVEIFL